MTDALRFERTLLSAPEPRLVEIQPIASGCIARWIAIGEDHRFYEWELGRLPRPLAAHIPDEIDVASPLVMRLSADARLAAIANRHGARGAVIELATGRTIVELERADDELHVCSYPLAFVARGGRDVLIHGRAWNRLDAIDAWTGEPLTARGPSPGSRNDPHGLDYFHCELVVSPSGERIAEHGWVWQPTGLVTTWSVARWLDENPWESEDGPSRRELCWRDDRWDDPLVWLDDDRLATWGRRFEDEGGSRRIEIFDARDGTALAALVCASCDRMFFDRYLFSIDSLGTWVRDVARGAIAHHASNVRPTHYHPTAKVFVALAEPDTFRLCGHDRDAPWATPRVRDVARAIDPARLADELQILGDALALAGCTDDELLAHCRAPGPHAGRCWALDRLH